MAMKRRAFDGFCGVTGGRVTAFIRQREGRDLDNNITTDRFFQKLVYPGSLQDNTASSYGYAGVFRHEYKTQFDPKTPGRMMLHGADGRVLTVDFRTIPDTNVGLKELSQVDLLLDATGEGVKKIKNKDQDPNHYSSYPNLTVLFSAPVKTVKGIPHHLNGITNVKAGPLNATGSCSTHAGVDLIHWVRMSIINALGLAGEDFVIEGGMFDTTHSLTPTDNKTLKYYDAAYVPQTTGFGGAAAVVYPIPHIERMDAATGRYYSYFNKDGIQANGVSIFSLTLNISVRRNKGEVTEDIVRRGLLEASQDVEGRKHIGILNSDVFSFDDNKNTGLFTGISMTGMTPTAILPLGKNIKVVKEDGVKIIEGVEYDKYTITIKNVAYDNRLGFVADMLEELNVIAMSRLGSALIPEFDHHVDLALRLAFIRTTYGRKMFRDALKLTEGNLLGGHDPIDPLLDAA